jgi:hypothetical protein
MAGKSKSVLLASLCAFAVPPIFYVMAFGVAVLLGAPRRPGQSFWSSEKLVYGVLLVVATVLLLVAVARRWSRLFSRTRTA